jgi:hypothetical protein
MIKITYRDLSPGLHAHAEPDGKNTVIHLLPGLTPQQRRAALQRIRRSGRMGHGPRVPVLGLAFALAVDRVRTTARNCAAVARLHPAGSALPVVLLSAMTVIYLSMATVHIHVLQAPGPSSQRQAVAGNIPAPVLPRPATARGSAPSAGSQDRGTRPGRPSGRLGVSQLASPGAPVTTAAPSDGWTLSAAGVQARGAGQTGSAADSAPGVQSSPTPASGSGSSGDPASNSDPGSSGDPAPSSDPGPSGDPTPDSDPGTGPVPADTPAPSPSPTVPSGSGVCVTLGSLGVCLSF